MRKHHQAKKNDQIQYIIQQNSPQPQHFTPPHNASTATFSNLSKQAESLVNGDISITFNNFNNHIMFRSKSVEMNDSVNIDVIHKKLQNIKAISFDNNSELHGISDGYTTNKQGAKVPLYDKNVALSTVFSYEYQHKIDALRRDLNSEIEKRRYEDELLRNRIIVLENDVSTLKSQVSVLENDVQTLKSDVQTLYSEINVMKPRIETLEEENKAQKIRISQLEALTKHFVI
jgi:chromosome segregation ATPase